MTGFGEAAGPCAGGRLSIAVRTVNHRGLSVRAHVPPALDSLAEDLERLARARFARGSVVVRLDWSAPPRIPDPATLAPVARALRRVHRSLGLSGGVGLESLLAVPGVLASPDVAAGGSAAKLRSAVVRLAGSAMAACARSRAREGLSLARDVARRLGDLGRARERIARAAPSLRVAALDRARRRLREASGGSARPEDVAREAGAATERADVAEEIARLAAHEAEARALLRRPGGVGRRLEFLAQEMNREANTLAAKCGSPRLLPAVLSLREAADRLREQSANVE